MTSLEPVPFSVVYGSAIVAAWLATYAVHSTLLIGAAWLLERWPATGRSARELAWKVALLGGVITTTFTLAAGLRPVAGRFDTAAFVEGRLWTAAALRFVPMVVVLLWSAYAAVVLTRAARAAWGARRALGARAPVPPATDALFQSVARSMGCRRDVRFTCSEQPTSPLALGPTEITLPRKLLDELSEDDQRSVVAHEVAHLLRRDPLWLLAAATAESVFFFQPLNRVARTKWQEQVEYVCDELVVRTQGSGLPLARALARVAEWLTSDPRQLLAPTLAEEPGTLLSRVEALLARDAPGPRPSLLARAPLLVVPMLVLLGAPAFAPGAVRGWGAPAFHWSGVVPAGQSIEVQGVLGSIRAEPWDRDSVELNATRHGRPSDPDIRFEVLRHARGVTVSALYPTPDSMPPNRVTPGATGQFNTRANDVEVEFVMRVPPGVNVVASTATGDISTGPLRGSVIAHSMSGRIDIDTSEHAVAESQSGDIRVSMGRTDWTDTLRLATRAGNIRLVLPATASTELSARTVTGEIGSDFEIGQAKSSWWSRLAPHGSLGSHAHGVLGNGGRVLELATVSGSIRVVRR